MRYNTTYLKGLYVNPGMPRVYYSAYIAYVKLIPDENT